MPTKISTENIQPASLATLEGPKISNVQITDSGGTVLDDTAVALTGGYIKLTGNGFQSGCQIKIGDALATSVTFVSATEVRAQVAAASAGTYDVYLVNSDGSYAIRISGLTYSATPSWVTASTLPEQAVDVAISIQLAATGATTYSLQSGSSLPAGVTLSSGGLISGTVTGIAEQTIYNFTIEAIDNELQDSPRAFSVTVTVGPPPGTLWSSGYNIYGQLGLNDAVYRSSPTQIGSLSTWNRISAGKYTFAAIKTDNTLWMWGFFPRINGITATYSSPVQVGSSTDWEKVSTGLDHTAAIKANGTLWVWGNKDFGAVGVTATDITSPVQLTASTDWTDVQAGANYNLALKTNGTLWAWGYNNTGQLGLGDTINRSSPTQVGSGTNWSKISNGAESGGVSGAIKADGTLWLWGTSSYGALGLNQSDGNNRSSPTQLGTATDWAFINISQLGGHAIKTSGVMWSWGFNNGGKLGLGNQIPRSSPTQVGSDTDWNSVYGRTASVAAIKGNNTVYFAGNDPFGAAGLNTTSPGVRTTFVQIPKSFAAVGVSTYSLIGILPS